MPAFNSNTILFLYERNEILEGILTVELVAWWLAEEDQKLNRIFTGISHGLMKHFGQNSNLVDWGVNGKGKTGTAR